MPNDPNFAVKVLLAEYASLKSEIYGRSRDQLLCITSSLIALGGIYSAIAISNGKFTILALIVPWILSVFGILWCDHHITIHYIGAYIRRIEKKEFISLLLDNQFFSNYLGWENWYNFVKRTQKDLPRYTFSFLHRILPILYFALPSLLSVLYYIYGNASFSQLWQSGFWQQFSLKLKQFPQGIILLIDLVLIGIFILYYVEALVSTKFKLTNTELGILKSLIYSTKDDDFILERFKKITGIEIEKKDLEKKRKEYTSIPSKISKLIWLFRERNQHNPYIISVFYYDIFLLAIFNQLKYESSRCLYFYFYTLIKRCPKNKPNFRYYIIIFVMICTNVQRIKKAIKKLFPTKN